MFIKKAGFSAGFFGLKKQYLFRCIPQQWGFKSAKTNEPAFNHQYITTSHSTR
jgi:hypothetical protein